MSSTPQNSIHIAIAPDRNYFNYALVTIASLLAHHPDGDIVLYVLHSDLNSNDFQRIKTLSWIGNFTLVPLQIGDSFLKDWPAMRWSISIYYRLILPSLLPDLDKIIYLDSDLILLDDVRKLWDFDLENHPCAAVAEHKLNPHLQGTCIPSQNAMFNSGVMLFNPHKMAENQDEKRFVELFDEYRERIKYPDQDILNLAYWNDFARLPLRWNLTASTYRNPPIPNYSFFSEEEIRAALHHPSIAHFTGLHKPWRLLKTTHHPYARYYRAYVKMAGLPLSFQFKMALKAIITGRLKSPKKKVPWDCSIIDKHLPLTRSN